MCVNAQCRGVKKTEANSPHWWPVKDKRQWALVKTQKILYEHKKKFPFCLFLVLFLVLFYCESIWMLEWVIQRHYGVSIRGNIQNRSEHGPEHPLLWGRAWTRWSPRVPSNLCYSMIVWIKAISCVYGQPVEITVVFATDFKRAWSDLMDGLVAFLYHELVNAVNLKLKNNTGVLNYFVALKVNIKMVWNREKTTQQIANDSCKLRFMELTCLSKWKHNYFSESPCVN